MLAGRVFFLQIDPASTSGMPRGVPYQIKSTNSMKLTGLANIQGLTLLPLYTSHPDKRLKGSYAEIHGLEALRMVVKCAGVDYFFRTKGNLGWFSTWSRLDTFWPSLGTEVLAIRKRFARFIRRFYRLRFAVAPQYAGRSEVKSQCSRQNPRRS